MLKSSVCRTGGPYRTAVDDWRGVWAEIAGGFMWLWPMLANVQIIDLISDQVLSHLSISPEIPQVIA